MKMISDRQNRIGKRFTLRGCYGGTGYFDPYYSGYCGGSGYYGNSNYGASAHSKAGNCGICGYPYRSCCIDNKQENTSPDRGVNINDLDRLSYQSPHIKIAPIFGVTNHYDKNFSYLFPPSP